MKTFLTWLEDLDDTTGIYPPEYGAGLYPKGYFNPSNPYIAASRKEHKKKKKHKHKPKK
jgi:hypothetical protein